MTNEQMQDVAENFLKKNRRPPKAKEFKEVAGEDIPASKLNAFLARFRKGVQTLHVIDGRVYDSDGKTVWFQSTRGSMMPAAFYPDEGIGQYISM